MAEKVREVHGEDKAHAKIKERARLLKYLCPALLFKLSRGG